MSAKKSLVGLSLGLVVTVTIALAASSGAHERASRVRPSTVVSAAEPAAALVGHRLRPPAIVGEPIEVANQGRWRYR